MLILEENLIWRLEAFASELFIYINYFHYVLWIYAILTFNFFHTYTSYSAIFIHVMHIMQNVYLYNTIK